MKKKCCAIAFLIVAVVSAGSGVRADGGEHVADEEEYARLEQGDALTVVEFYSRMCGSCKVFSREWESAVEQLSGEINFRRVCIDDGHGMKIANKVGALTRGIPHVRVLLDKEGPDAELVHGRSVESSVLVEKVRHVISEAGATKRNGRFVKANAAQSEEL